MPGFFCKGCGLDKAFGLNKKCDCSPPLAFTHECPKCHTLYTNIHNNLFCIRCLASKEQNTIQLRGSSSISITPVKHDNSRISLTTVKQTPVVSLLAPPKQKQDKPSSSLSLISVDESDGDSGGFTTLDALKQKYNDDFKKVGSGSQDVLLLARQHEIFPYQDNRGHSLALIKTYFGRPDMEDAVFFHPHTVYAPKQQQTAYNHIVASNLGGSGTGNGYGMVFIRNWDSTAQRENEALRAGRGVTLALVVRHNPKFVPDEIRSRFWIVPPLSSGKKKVEALKNQGKPLFASLWSYINQRAQDLDHLLILNIGYDDILEMVSTAVGGQASLEDVAQSTFQIDVGMINISKLETDQKDRFVHEAGYPEFRLPGLKLKNTKLVRAPTTYTQLSKGKSVKGLDTKYPRLCESDCKIVSSIEAEAEFSLAPTEENEAVLEMFIEALWDTAGFDDKGEKNWWNELKDENKRLYGFHQESWLNDGKKGHLTIDGLDGWQVFHVPKYWRNFEKKFWTKTTKPSWRAYKDPGLRMYHRPVFDIDAPIDPSLYEGLGVEMVTVTSQDLVPLRRNRYCNGESKAFGNTRIPMMAPWPLYDFYLDTPSCLILSNGGSLRIRDNARGGDLVNVKGLAVKIDNAATVRYCANLDLKSGAGATLFRDDADAQALAEMKALILDPETLSVHDCLESVLGPVVREQVQRSVLTRDVHGSSDDLRGVGICPSPGRFDVYGSFASSSKPCPLACRLKVVSERHRFVFQAPMSMGGAKIELSFDLSCGSVGTKSKMVLGMEFGLEHMGRSLSEMSHKVEEEPIPSLSIKSKSGKQGSSGGSGPTLLPIDNRLYDPYDLADEGISNANVARNRAFLHLRNAMLALLDELLAKHGGKKSTDTQYVCAGQSPFIRVAGYKANQLALDLGLIEPLYARWTDRRFDKEDILDRPSDLPEATPRLRNW